jgi:hypothetical protein
VVCPGRRSAVAGAVTDPRTRRQLTPRRETRARSRGGPRRRRSRPGRGSSQRKTRDRSPAAPGSSRLGKSRSTALPRGPSFASRGAAFGYYNAWVVLRADVHDLLAAHGVVHAVVRGEHRLDDPKEEGRPRREPGDTRIPPAFPTQVAPCGKNFPPKTSHGVTGREGWKSLPTFRPVLPTKTPLSRPKQTFIFGKIPSRPGSTRGTYVSLPCALLGASFFVSLLELYLSI